jgi:hypothetical protein
MFPREHFSKASKFSNGCKNSNLYVGGDHAGENLQKGRKFLQE